MSSIACSAPPNCVSAGRSRRWCGFRTNSPRGGVTVTEPVEPPAKIAPPKADPETLVLRAAPGRVTRFRRGAIVAIAVAGSTAIIGVAWLALKPATLNLVAADDDRPQLPANVSAESRGGHAPRSNRTKWRHEESGTGSVPCSGAGINKQKNS